MLVSLPVVVCWRGWWHLMDSIGMKSWVSLLIGTLITLAHYWVRPMMPEWPQDSLKQTMYTIVYSQALLLGTVQVWRG
eukprot:CAMPEP_0182539982 /NCGR_PEP_ID=MMETSP1323-20130603/26312_1 /TAXON_ID=236787 /ORGANISM="Florenciella parvula, Strain RCC1693" /LENGTH=77 /DNA_ID=CAMNT_0024750599 /DNA_START=1 /DNA_END=230 /DNA_ORIENTATION=+